MHQRILLLTAKVIRIFILFKLLVVTTAICYSISVKLHVELSTILVYIENFLLIDVSEYQVKTNFLNVESTCSI